jgi:ribosomal protein L11 methyltransferase
VTATHANVVLNEVDGQVEVLFGSLNAVPQGKFDFICANINAGTIMRLAGDMARRMRPGARMLAGGVIAEREASVREALEASGLVVERVLVEADWRTLVVVQPA